jgi:hypothetical protein
MFLLAFHSRSAMMASMKKKFQIDGQEVTLATITIEELETAEMDGKTGRKWNIAMVAASIRSAGDAEHGTEAWVRSVKAFDPEGGDGEFKLLVDAMNEVNGFKAALEKKAAAPEAPAAP